jgi:hypothetical protein
MMTVVRLPFSVLVSISPSYWSQPAWTLMLLAREVDLFGPERAQLAEAHRGVHRAAPQRLLFLIERRDEAVGFIGGRDPVASQRHGGKPQALRRVGQQRVVRAGNKVEVAPQHPRCVDAGVNLAGAVLGLPYGDAGLQVRALDVAHEVHPQLGMSRSR